MTLFLTFNTSGSEPVEINRERFSTEKERVNLIRRAQTDKSLIPGARIQVIEIGNETRAYPLEDA